MSAGSCVVASDIGAFRRVLDEGKAGVLFSNADSADLAATLIRTLRDPDGRAQATAAADAAVRRYDWSVVTNEILTVYEMALAAFEARVRVTEDPSSVRVVRTGSKTGANQ